jgi:ribose/xylose/arabinose/galactoside ABC-type transport system permease subunit
MSMNSTPKPQPTVPEPQRPEPRSARGTVWTIAGGALGPLLALMVVVVGFGIADTAINGLEQGKFFTERNFRSIALNTVVVAIAALGMTVIIIAGGIDLSAGTALALASTVLAWLLQHDYHVALAVAACIATGAAAGLFNGVLVSGLGIVPFIVTLGTMTMFVGIGNVISKDTNIRPRNVPEGLTNLVIYDADKFHFGFPMGVWLALGLAAALAAVLRYTVFGRYVFALGSNEATARLCGIDVPRMKIAVYTLGGFFFGIAGICLFGYTAQADPMSGLGMELKVIAAVVIGGASLSGGRGSVLGTLTGALMMEVIGSGCTQIGIPSSVERIVTGAVIISAAALDQFRQRRLSSL